MQTASRCSIPSHLVNLEGKNLDLLRMEPYVEDADSLHEIVAVTSPAVAQENRSAVVVGKSKDQTAENSLDIVAWIPCQS